MLTSSKVGEDGSTCDRPIDGIHGDFIAGTGKQINKLIFLFGPVHQNSFSCN